MHGTDIVQCKCLSVWQLYSTNKWAITAMNNRNERYLYRTRMVLHVHKKVQSVLCTPNFVWAGNGCLATEEGWKSLTEKWLVCVLGVERCGICHEPTLSTCYEGFLANWRELSQYFGKVSKTWWAISVIKLALLPPAETWKILWLGQIPPRLEDMCWNTMKR